MVSDSSLLGHQQLAALRLTKLACRDINADRQLFSSPHFSIFPPHGSINPNSEQEVIVQFAPDSAGSFEALAWVDIQGLGQRLPLQLLGEGQGPVVVLSYGDVLDIGEAFVNMEQHYELELLNKGKVGPTGLTWICSLVGCRSIPVMNGWHELLELYSY